MEGYNVVIETINEVKSYDNMSDALDQADKWVEEGKKDILIGINNNYMYIEDYYAFIYGGSFKF